MIQNFLERVLKFSYEQSWEEEDFYSYKATFSNVVLAEPSSNWKKGITKKVKYDDIGSLTIVRPSGETAVLRSSMSDSEVESFTEEATSFYKLSTVNIEYRIDKKTATHFNIYSWATFTKHFLSKNSSQQINQISQAFEDRNHCIICCEELAEEFQTSTILFTKKYRKNLEAGLDRVNRRELLEKMSEIQAVSDERLDCIPQDFYLISQPLKHTELSATFDNLATILSIIGLFNKYNLQNDIFSGVLIGYKAYSFSWKVTDSCFSTSLKQYYQIFNWVYQSGSLIDKIGLTRNILSLHLSASDSSEIIGNPYEGILSSFKIFERQNIRQYLEIRNKLFDTLLDLNSKATKLVDGYSGSFQRSAVALITYFVSVFLVKLYSGKSILQSVNVEIFALSTIMLLGSVLYMIISRSEVIELLKRHKKIYTSTVRRQTDLLNVDDINRILENHDSFKDDLTFVRKKIRHYTMFWICSVVLLFLLSVFLFIKTMTTNSLSYIVALLAQLIGSCFEIH